MPIGRKYDFQLGGYGFMLVRGSFKGRAWSRSGRADTPGQRTSTDAKFGVLPDELDRPEVWDDWSGGFGHAYRTPDAANTYHWSENFDARFKGQLVHCQAPNILASRYAPANANADRFIDVPLPGVASPPAGAGAVLITGKNYVVHVTPTALNTEGSAFDGAWEATGAHFNGRSTVFGSFVYLGVEASPFVQRTFDGSMAQGPSPGQHFTVAGGNLVRAHSRCYIQQIAPGGQTMSTGDWTATLRVGNGQMAIKDLTTLGEQIYAGLADGLYAGDLSGTFMNVLPGPAGAPNEDNGRDLDIVEGPAVIGPYADDLVWFRPSDLVAEARQIGPMARGPERGPIKGRLRAQRSFGPWVYAGLWTGSQSYLLAGRPGGQGMIWHPQQRLPHVARVNRIHIDGITTPSGGGRELPVRFWVATDASGFTGTAPTYYWPIPRLNGDPLGGDPTWTANFVGSARMDLGRVNWGAPGTLKLFKQFEVWADNLASGSRYLDVFYSVDEGPRTWLGRATESPKSVLWFPSSMEGFVTGQNIAISVESYCTTPTISPVYRSFILRGALLPNSIDVITAVVNVGDNVKDRQGHPMRSGAVMISQLRSMAKPTGLGAIPQLLTDLAGATCWVNVLRPIEEQETYQGANQDPDIAVTVRMAVLDMSVNLGDSMVAIDDVGVMIPT